MNATLTSPDLDALDHAALKTMIVQQHEKYTAILTSRSSEIERLGLLVEKLQRKLFGNKEREGPPPD